MLVDLQKLEAKGELLGTAAHHYGEAIDILVDKGTITFAESVRLKRLVPRRAGNLTIPAKHPTLNLGSGNNPMANAVNVERFAGTGVDAVADARHLPFATGAFDEVVAINPAAGPTEFFNPLAGDVARVLKPGGTVTVVGQPRNFAFRQLKKMDDEALRALGFERVTDATPVDPRFIFGQAARADGIPIDMSNARQIIFRRLGDSN